jgi:hypothetical protein
LATKSPYDCTPSAVVRPWMSTMVLTVLRLERTDRTRSRRLASWTKRTLESESLRM